MTENNSEHVLGKEAFRWKNKSVLFIKELLTEIYIIFNILEGIMID